jgi:hypothetical protein
VTAVESWAKTTLDGVEVRKAKPSKARKYLDSVEGTDDEVWRRAMEYGHALRKNLGVPTLVVSVERKRGRLHYLYLEAA